jgi:hypothetical protein
MIKRTQKESDRETNTNSGRNLSNRTADKDRFFRGSSVAQIEKCKTNESLEINWGICTRNRRSKRYSENLHEFLRCNTKICFRTATSQIFADEPLHGEVVFRCHFWMSWKIFLDIVFAVWRFDNYFICKNNCTGMVGFSSLQKCTAAFADACIWSSW